MKLKGFTDTVAKAASNKRTMLIAVSCILVAIAVACCMCTCSPVSDSGDETSTQSSTQSGTAVASGSSNGASKGDSISAFTETKDAEDAITNPPASSDTSSSNSIDTAQGRSGDSSDQTETVSSGASQTSGGSSVNTDVAALMSEKIWVEDSAARDEQTPVYGYVEKSACNICGAEITGNEAAHGKAHMLAGEGSGHHTDVSQVVTGYAATHHDAIGHYETIESGGHWE